MLQEDFQRSVRLFVRHPVKVLPHVTHDVFGIGPPRIAADQAVGSENMVDAGHSRSKEQDRGRNGGHLTGRDQ